MWMIGKLWPVALIAALGLALVGIGYAWGDKRASSQCVADQALSQQAAQAKVDETNTRREEVAQSRETSREQIRVVYRTIREKADELKTTPHPNPLPASGARGNDFACGLDADGLRLWNAANAGNTAPLLGKLDYRLPGAASGEVGQFGRPAGQPHRGDGAVQPVPGQTEETGGMRGAVTAPPHPNPLPMGEGANAKNESL